MATREFITKAPSKLLEPYVYFYFQQKISGDRQKNPHLYRQTTLPTGCTFLGFNFNGSLVFDYRDQVGLIDYPVYISGQQDRMYAMEMPQDSDLFGVVLKPTTACRLTRIPISELRNFAIEANYHLDKSLKELHGKMMGSDINSRVLLFEQWLGSQVLKQRQDPVFTDWAVEEIINRKGIIHTNTLAQTLKVSERHLQRAFKERIGLRPHQYATIVKVNHIVNDFNRTKAPLIDLLCQYEYYDKSHFRKQFRAITHTTLSSYMGFQNEAAQSFLKQIAF